MSLPTLSLTEFMRKSNVNFISCASLLGVQSSKYISEKIEIGMSKNEFQKLFGEPYAKEMITDRYNRPVE